MPMCLFVSLSLSFLFSKSVSSPNATEYATHPDIQQTSRRNEKSCMLKSKRIFIEVRFLTCFPRCVFYLSPFCFIFILNAFRCCCVVFLPVFPFNTEINGIYLASTRYTHIHTQQWRKKRKILEVRTASVVTWNSSTCKTKILYRVVEKFPKNCCLCIAIEWDTEQSKEQHGNSNFNLERYCGVLFLLLSSISRTVAVRPKEG